MLLSLVNHACNAARERGFDMVICNVDAEYGARNVTRALPARAVLAVIISIMFII